MKKTKLPCGYTAIPLVVNGQSPSKQVNDIAQRTFVLLEQDSADDKLSANYTLSGLKLHEMLVYSVLWDFKADKPVLVTGAQHMSDNTCRLFSRYYLFKDYRTGTDNSRYDKVDDFKTLEYNKNNCRLETYEEKVKDHYKLFFGFETITSEYKHMPYLCCIYNDDIQQEFIGINTCAVDMLNALPTDKKEILLIAHNSDYDCRLML